MPLPIVTVNIQYTAALIDLQKKKSLLTKRSSKMDVFDTTSQEVVNATNAIADEVEALEPVSEDPEKANKQLVEIKVCS
jgi:trans-aconitate methyltransferase